MVIRVRMSAREFRDWRDDRRVRARKAALNAAPEAFYVSGTGWCGPGWEKAMLAYCEALVGKDEVDA